MVKGVHISTIKENRKLVTTEINILQPNLLTELLSIFSLQSKKSLKFYPFKFKLTKVHYLSILYQLTCEYIIFKHTRHESGIKIFPRDKGAKRLIDRRSRSWVSDVVDEVANVTAGVWGEARGKF